MGRWISEDTSSRIAEVMFRDFSDNPASRLFISNEMIRYIPQFTGLPDEAITDFGNYQRKIWLEGEMPVLGKPIACLNPKFVGSVDDVVVSPRDFQVYTRAAQKENGYRFQLHNGPQGVNNVTNASAVTRQFTPYDLRMFPELRSLFPSLPVMIGDSELINAKHPHLAGFNRVQERIPTKMWPSRETGKIEDSVLLKYLQSTMFVDGKPTGEFSLTLAFHGLFAIAEPDSWNLPHKKQMDRMISMCTFPMDYRRVDELLDELSAFIKQKELNARVVERAVIENKQELRRYVDINDNAGLEGTVIVQSAKGERALEFAKSIKIKKYETIDTVLLGVYLARKDDGLVPENMTAALLGLYDAEHDCYLPVCKVNLDPEGKQIKEDHQRERLTKLRQELADALGGKEYGAGIIKLYDLYIMEAKKKLGIYLGDAVNPESIGPMLDSLPRGQDFLSLLDAYKNDREKYDLGELGQKKNSVKKDQWIYNNKDILSAVSNLRENNRGRYRDLVKYFRMASEVKNASAKLVTPGFVADTTDPPIIEAQVFDIKYALNPFPAGFHSSFGNSFKFNNCYAEIIRRDKASTTDYITVQEIARQNTVRKGR